ncbi:hypothetical protein FOMG_16859 [Fusarium oxysporum f. sp. melonis 26406]|uniref:Uncharacterized protein n=2 Tax=Fusarium oxysporum TaxID=5507 RepID=X0M2M6_FUSOX|nr:hypothetical protein FOMG_16859 [Fusarium oxysporum f. sp. melonis 26406]EXM14915.1 hypothetical protein FOTG_16714 [Fusarium oxysporum f. sp. vasinfectum 25433]
MPEDGLKATGPLLYSDLTAKIPRHLRAESC